MKLWIGEAAVEVDAEATRQIYESLCPRRQNSADRNFLKNLALRSEAVERFFRPFGIIAENVQALYIDHVDAELQAVCYAGFYPIVCTHRIRAEKTLMLCRDACESAQTQFGFEISFSMFMGQPALFFSAKLPWLFENPIPKQRYVNRPVLPEAV